MKKVLAMGVMVYMAIASFSLTAKAADQSYTCDCIGDSQSQIDEEIKLGEMELIAQLVEAEAGNQDLEGKRLVVDVIMNRVKSDKFPNTVEEVIFQKGQFSVVTNGAFEKAAYNMQETDYEAVELEYDIQSNTEVLFFNCNKRVSGSGTPFKVGGHYFNS